MRIAIHGLAFAALLSACSSERDLPLSNPVDPRSDAYVGHEIQDSHDPINVPSVEITAAPVTMKINVPYNYVATPQDPNDGSLPRDQPGAITGYVWDFGDGAQSPTWTQWSNQAAA